MTFAERFTDLLPTRAQPTGIELMALPGGVGFPPGDLLDQVQPRLRNIWKEPAPLLKEAGLMILAAAYMKECSPPQGEPDYGWATSPLEQLGLSCGGPDRFLMVLLYALKHVHLLRYCANPECKEPYFVARRGSQIYCSAPCATPAQKEAKLKWWNAHGNASRKKSRKQRGKHAKAKKA
jgi:hypothetical protein